MIFRAKIKQFLTTDPDFKKQFLKKIFLFLLLLYENNATKKFQAKISSQP